MQPFGGTAATFGVSIFNAMANRFLNLEISALEADSKGRLVSSPRVVTSDGKKAIITQGEQIPYQSSTKDGVPTTSFKDAKLKLEVTPQITPEDPSSWIWTSARTHAEENAGNAGPAINGKNVVTQVLVDNGGTVVIGGIQLEETTDEAKVPWFCRSPCGRQPVQKQIQVAKEKRIAIFVTPRIIADKLTSSNS